MISFDALFGLPRKAAAGSSFREPHHGHLMFGDQSAVDEFVATSPQPRMRDTGVRRIIYQ